MIPKRSAFGSLPMSDYLTYLVLFKNNNNWVLKWPLSAFKKYTQIPFPPSELSLQCISSGNLNTLTQAKHLHQLFFFSFTLYSFFFFYTPLLEYNCFTMVC